MYDFSCGALRSAVGKLPGFVALVVIISELLHIVSHVYSDIFIPRPYSPLDGKNTVAHEQRNAPIAAMIKTLRACGQDECMPMMKLHTIVHNVHAHARSTWTYPLPDDYNIRQFYFSKQTCLCGCEQQDEEPQLPSPPSSAPSTPTPSSTGMTLSSGSEEELLNALAALPAELAVTAASATASAMRIMADVLAYVKVSFDRYDCVFVTRACTGRAAADADVGQGTHADRCRKGGGAGFRRRLFWLDICQTVAARSLQWWVL